MVSIYRFFYFHSGITHKGVRTQNSNATYEIPFLLDIARRAFRFALSGGGGCDVQLNSGLVWFAVVSSW